MNTSDQEAIRKLINDWATAVRNKNLDGIVAHHSPDMLMFDVPPPLQSKGIEAYKATWNLFYSGTVDRVVFEILDLDITAGTEVAFATAIMRCIDCQEGELTFRLTIGLRKLSGQWLITHEHHSVPAA